MSRFNLAPFWFISWLESVERSGWTEDAAKRYNGEIIVYYGRNLNGFRVTLDIEYGTLKVLFGYIVAVISTPFNPLPPNTVIIQKSGDFTQESIATFQQLFNSEMN